MMQIGMLWFDNDKQTDCASKIKRAAEYYHDKYGVKPTLCFVNPLAIDDSEPEIEVRPSGDILPNHLWIGVDV